MDFNVNLLFCVVTLALVGKDLCDAMGTVHFKSAGMLYLLVIYVIIMMSFSRYIEAAFPVDVLSLALSRGDVQLYKVGGEDDSRSK